MKQMEVIPNGNSEWEQLRKYLWEECYYLTSNNILECYRNIIRWKYSLKLFVFALNWWWKNLLIANLKIKFIMKNVLNNSDI